MAGVQNGDWSVAGTEAGMAEDWTVTTEYNGEEVAAFDEFSHLVGTEGWETDWIADLTAVLLETAEFEQNGPDPGEEDLVEDCEAGWPSYVPYLMDMGTSEQALFDAGAQDRENFEDNWTGVPSGPVTWDDADFVDDGGAPTEFEPWSVVDWLVAVWQGADFLPGVQPQENFEADWDPMDNPL